MAKGSGTTKYVGSSQSSAANSAGVLPSSPVAMALRGQTSYNKGTSMSKAQIESNIGVSENVFFNYTGYKFGHPVSTYKEGLEILNKLPDSADMFTGHKAGEAKAYLKKIIKILS
ncbi:hypothetical protein SAMN04487851_114100 [Prevotella sp. tc2-28]|uniref:hypothetical protein n=1 Tax=Prevotella sp. tc2-28 TaxID=1761888 RepID=UPI0008983D48|nr:hypothetical protein [Prevotella sp. tc2-28]SEA80695.1 hypothetical protein SAMN04487851_114100 [Prevotella sp. tc2-28]